MTVENTNLIRTIASYNDDVLTGNFTETGIKERCVFNEINKFHICENISLDVMHDVCEGITPYTIENVLHALIKDKVLTLNTINNRIEKFTYNDVEKCNKPRLLYFTQGDKGGQKIKIKQSASEMLYLTRYLGLMIGDIIPAKNKYWKVYLCLRKIIGILTSPTLTRGQMKNLHELVKKHNTLYLTLFGKLKPKMHLLLHYPRAMLLNGPAIHYSAMKYERKNCKLKEVAIGTKSNTNLPPVKDYNAIIKIIKTSKRL